MTTGRRWTTPEDIVTKLRRKWNDGTFLRMLAHEEAWEPLSLPISGPGSREIADRFAEVQAWVESWRAVDGTTFRVERKRVGGRTLGDNTVPARAWVDDVATLCSTLDVTDEATRYKELLEEARDRAPRVVEWLIDKPHRALAVERVWTELLDTACWIEQHAGPDVYLRQIDVPGVDTKFVESNRNTLAALLDLHIDASRIDDVHSVSEFERRYRFRRKPSYVRYRTLDPSRPLAGVFSELTVNSTELAANPPEASRVYVIENETTFLALPDMPDSIAIFGSGYALTRLDTLDWLEHRELCYWGDIDTHGFRILNNLRRRFSHTRSILMDRSTLIDHRRHWVHEGTQVNSPLPQLRPAEAELYQDLVENTLGPSVRLEQERIRYSRIKTALRP